MKAVDTNLLVLLKKSNRFVVPIYQRVYSWEKPECEQLWTDIVRAGTRKKLNNHFTGSIVYIESDESSNTSREPDLLIDGQQRVTTTTILLAALAARLEKEPEGEQEPVPGFSPRKIRGHYLINDLEDGEDYFKLTLTQRDKPALKAVVQDQQLDDSSSRVVSNFQYFVEKLKNADRQTIEAVCKGIDKLVVVDVKLSRSQDDPQLVFESMNATGKKLSQADLIRNFVLMDLQPGEQERVYEDDWYPMEQRFAEVNERRFDEFVRHYLTLKTKKIPRIADVYEAFKEYAYSIMGQNFTKVDLVKDLSSYAKHFAAMALGQETDSALAWRFKDIEQLATIAYPLQLRLYSDYESGLLSKVEFQQILDATISYLFRRNICNIPPNSLNKTFAGLLSVIDENHYAESIIGRYLTLPDYRRFPSDSEFVEALKNNDLYSSKKRSYFLGKFENFARKEEVSVADYTIEHIMPQTLTAEWKAELGADWKSVHEHYLHTLGNLTLTGYNPEYSNKSFELKRDMKGGFAQSPLRLNEGLGALQSWGETEMKDRAERLAGLALEIWSSPVMYEETVEKYRVRYNEAGSFDWSLAEQILEAIPAGSWTSYNNLAEAAGTGPQAMAQHLSRTPGLKNAYRVLTWDGRVAENFHWSDESDTRKPAELLEVEGVKMESGVADAGQKLSAEELLNLVEEDDA